MEKRERYVLLSIIFVSLVIRLLIAFSIPNLTYESYFHLRQVEHIHDTGIPLYNDPLSYGGRTLHFLPLFHYLAAAFSFLLPIDLVAKLLPNILLSTIPFLVYHLSKKITTNGSGPLLASFVSAFLPILFTTNAFTPETLFLPLTFFTLYCFLRGEERKYQYRYILAFLLLSITSPATVFILIGFGIYVILSLIERKKLNSAESELMIFSVFFFLWSQFIFFKDNFLTHGISFIWRNIPSQVIYEYLPRISLPKALLLVSIIPFLAGIYVAYRSLFELKNEKSFLLISFVISTTLLAWARLIRFNFSLAFFGIILSILFASFYNDAITFVKQTRAPWLHKYLAPSVLLLLILTTVLPALNTAQEQTVPRDEEIVAFEWIRTNLPEQATIASSVEEGHLITYFAQRRNILDDNFALIDDAEERFTAISTLYTTPFQTEAINLFSKYSTQYLVLTPHSSLKYKIARLPYLTPECFERVYKNKVQIYKVKCIISKTT